jgi:DNA-binding MarR family transcriptional regulator
MDDNSPTLGFLLHTCARLLKKRFEQNARDSGLTRSQWQVLAYLSKVEGINQAGLAELLDLEPITVGRIVDKLEEMSLIERRPHPTDRRVWELHLAPAAHKPLENAKKIGDATRAEALAGISAADRVHLVKTLQAVSANLVKACEAPPIEPKVEQKRARHV